MTPDFPEPAREIDAALLSKALDYVTAHPDEWDQGSWARWHPTCGTTACLAGTAVTMAGYEIDWKHELELYSDGSRAAALTVDGHRIEELAAELFGLHELDAGRLFHYYGRDVGELWRRAAQITDGAVVVPPEYVLADR